MQELTKKQRRLLDFIVVRVNSIGVPPTLEEMANYMRVTITPARMMMLALEKKGYITRKKNARRHIELTREEIR